MQSTKRNKEIFHSASSQRGERRKGKRGLQRLKTVKKIELPEQDKTNGYFRQRNDIAKTQLKYLIFDS